jgi:hypothetical protein
MLPDAECVPCTLELPLAESAAAFPDGDLRNEENDFCNRFILTLSQYPFFFASAK